jgi:hypothetical protein
MIVVTGLIRSGTSPIARMLHQMGIPMGEHMRFPMLSNASHLEWEDSPFADVLMFAIKDKWESERVRGLLAAYIKKRTDRHGDTWGVKSPYLLPFIGDLQDIAKSMGVDMKLVTTIRPYEDTEKSIHEQVAHLVEEDKASALDVLLGLQSQLKTYVGQWDADLEIDIERTKRFPKSVALDLSDLTGIAFNMEYAVSGIWTGSK